MIYLKHIVIDMFVSLNRVYFKKARGRNIMNMICPVKNGDILPFLFHENPQNKIILPTTIGNLPFFIMASKSKDEQFPPAIKNASKEVDTYMRDYFDCPVV